MTPDWVEPALKSASPDERSRAIVWLIQNPTEVQITALLGALQTESTPQLRRLLNEVLRRRQLLSVSEPAADDPREQSGWSGDVASLIRHELAPAIGWIRLAADAEIPNYGESATESAIRKLQRRVDGLTALIKQRSSLEIRTHDLIALVRESWPDSSSDPAFEPDVARGQLSVAIETDEALFTILLQNALQNSIDGSIEASRSVDVTVSWGATTSRFWLRIANPFVGAQFKKVHVAAEGVSSKIGHQGQGLAVMTTAAQLLGLGFELEGLSGTATFTLNGRVRGDD